MEATTKTLYEIPELLKENGGPLPLSRAGIYLAAKNGEIPTVHVGRRIFVPSWYIDSLLNPPNMQQNQ